MNTLDYQRIFHEIKNSITLIDSSMQLLGHAYPELNQISYWHNTRNEMDHLKKIILEFSQIGDIEHLHIDTIDINELLSQTLMSVKDSYPNLIWRLQLDQQLPPIPVDGTKLKQAIINLLKNSAEAIQTGGSIAIVSSQDAADSIRIDITDSGGGIPVDAETKIFQPFYTSKANGTGLGLAITRQIINQHGGQLTLKNLPGTGCTFSILLPMSYTS